MTKETEEDKPELQWLEDAIAALACAAYALLAGLVTAISGLLGLHDQKPPDG